MLKRFHPFALSRNHLMNIWDHFHSVSIFPSNSSSVFSPGLHFWVNQIQMCSVQANLKVQTCFHPLLWLAAGNGRSKGRTNSPPSCILGVRIFSFLPAFFTDTGKMASAHDRAVLQAIFNPSTPFGDIPGLNQEEELIDDGERVPPTWCVSTYHVTAFFLCLSFHSILNLFERVPFLELKKKKHDILIQVDFWVTFLCFPCHGTCQLSLSAFSTCLSSPARQWLWHGVAEASERVGDAGCLCSRGWGFASCTSTVQPGNPDPASASLSL